MCFKDTEFRVFIFHICLLLCLIQCRYCNANVTNNITWLQTLPRGKTLVSPSQIFELGFFSPENSVNQYLGIWYLRISPQTVVWVMNRENPLAVTDTSASLRFTNNGNLELSNGVNDSLWSTNISSRSNNSIAVLEDTGNFVIRDVSSGEQLWESFDHLGSSFLPGSVLAFGDRLEDRKVLTSWRDDSDPSPGSFSFGIFQQRPSQAFIWTNGTIPYWRSGPWDKSKFVGVPNMFSSYQSPLSIEEDTEKGTTSLVFDWHGKPGVVKMTISPKGILQFLQKEENISNWVTLWEAPTSPCDIYGVCGPFGVCKEDTEKCECLNGFVPKSSQEWSRGTWTGGCVRRTELLCEKNNSSGSGGGEPDGFQKIGGLKIPDFYEFLNVEPAGNCPVECANNCSCTAYAYVSGIGCLMWFNELIDIMEFSSGGEELFIRLAHNELGVGGLKVKRIVISIVVVSGCVLIAATVLAMYVRRATRKGKKKQTRWNLFLNRREDTSAESNDAITKQNNSPETRTFDLDVILVATNNFSLQNKLGQGGFGPVYKGKLDDDQEIAVKRLSTKSKQGIEEFRNEVTLISKLQHRNLVRLIGCCSEKEEKILIYEFMPNKSLDVFIFDPSKSGELNWETRFNIILGIARGLLYLHRDSCLRIIHRDLKVSNILLDDKLNPKISDFGLSRIFEGTSDIANTHKVVGTIGYMSPEYALAGDFSEKSDVFSFGVLMLEIISGKKNTSFNDVVHNHLSLISYAWELWSKNRGHDLVDDALAESYSSPEVTRCIHVGLLCVQDHVEDRPTMPDVVFMLSNETNRPQPKRPTFVIKRSSQFNLQAQDYGSKFSNKFTISLIEGR